MSTAPFDKYLASVKSGDSESDKMRALLRAYPSLGKGFTRIAKQDDVEEEPPREDEDPDAAVESEEAADADDEEDERQEDEARKQHLVDVLSDLLVTAHEGAITKPEALRHLMHSARGAAMVRRLHRAQKRMKKEQTMSHTEELALIAKRDGGISAICKHVIERRGSSSITEHELTKLISDNVERRPGETREQAFCRAFEAPDAEGLAMRKAVAVLRHHPVAEAAPRSVAGGTVSGDAYGKLLAKAEEARRADPSLTREQSFAKIYADPANVELARAERAANRPHA